MRRILSLFTMLMLCGLLASAQNRVVSGRITDKDGASVAFASVKIKNTKLGTQADANGGYSIKVKDGDVLEISAAGYKTMEVATGTLATVNSVLDKTGTLVEVVVTGAYGKKATLRSATANTQNISNEKLNTIRPAAITDALAGKVAGAQIRSQSAAALGVDASIRIRGEGTVYGAGVLYVVDGTPVGSSDVNTDDVEDVTVLNGASAAARFGPAAAQGAIVINTKRAKKFNNGIGLELNAGVQFDRIYVLPNYQNSYAGGSYTDLVQYHWQDGQPEAWKALDGKFYPDYSDDASWGPRMVGQEYIPWYAWYPGSEYSYKTAKLTPQPNNAKDFYNTGVTFRNNVNFSKSGEGYNARISFTNVDQKGITPSEYLKKNTLAANGSYDLSKNFTVTANINYVTQYRRASNDDGYANQTTGTFNSWFHRDLEMDKIRELSDLRSPEGILASWNHSNPEVYSSSSPKDFYAGNYWYNFYSYLDNAFSKDRRDRFYGDASLTWKPSPDFRIKTTFRKNQITAYAESYVYRILEDGGVQTGSGGALKNYYGTNQSNSREDRYEALASYNKKIKDFTLGLDAGGEIIDAETKSVVLATQNGLYIKDYFVAANSYDNLATANSRVKTQRRAAYLFGNFNYKNYLFFDFTLRQDWSSTLPTNKSSVFIKSAGLGFVFSDLTKTTLPFLSLGKLRLNIGETLEIPGAYAQTADWYTIGSQSWDNIINNQLLKYRLQGTPNTIANRNLVGAVNSTKEIGLDLKFLKNRIGISASYYNAVTRLSPLSIPINGASGYTSITTNVGRIDRSGVEMQLSFTPILTKNFAWELTGTYSYNLNNKITELAPQLDKIGVSGGASFSGISPPIVYNITGQQWGQLIGGGKKRINGVPVITADGFFVQENEVNFGSVLPNYTGGFQNSFTVFKNFIFNVNIDFQSGGKFFSLSDMWGTYGGLTARTAVLNDKGNPIRDAVLDGGGVHVVGVDENGKAADKYVDAKAYFHNMVDNNIFDDYIHDLTFVKMREVSLGYKIPTSKLKAGKWLQSATFSIMLRNPWIIYRTTKDFDPAEISDVYGEDGQLPGTRAIGINLKLGF